MTVVKHGWSGKRAADGDQTSCGMWIRGGSKRSEAGGYHVFAPPAQANCGPCEAAALKAGTAMRKPAYV